jgi:FkbM family methyltransferase
MLQKALLKAFSLPLAGRIGQQFLRDRLWRVENGQGAGLKVTFPQNRDFITGLSEIPVQNALARHLPRGGTFYDVGANVGFFSLISARMVGPSGNVYAFEPVAANVKAVRANAGANSFHNVHVFEVAVSNAPGAQELLLTDWDGGGMLETSAVPAASPTGRVCVSVVVLDDFIRAQKLLPPTFVKIDVEGVEFEVLQGMSRTLAEHKPVLLYEIDDGDKQSFTRRRSALDQFVAGFGYDVSHLEESYPGTGWNVGHTLALPRK